MQLRSATKETQMQSDVVRYLNPELFFSKLREQVSAAKMAKMPPDQWVAFIKGLTGKGVKQAEIDDAGIVAALQASSERSLTKEEVLAEIDRLSVTVKEVVLGNPEYRGWSHWVEGDTYQEILYIANSEKANMEDRIEEIEFTMEELSFDQDKLLANPGLASKLEAERRYLLKQKPTAHDFNIPHFSERIKGKHGKNVLFHARVVIRNKPDGGKLYFIDEIQSDWGQVGRLRLHEKEAYRARGEQVPSWRPNVVKGPWVSDTKLWAGLALRRLLQRAAETPGVNEVSWIRLCMRNGGMTDPRLEDANRPAADEDGDESETDHYYSNLIPSLADALLSKAGTKVTHDHVVHLKGKEFGNLPGFKMNDSVRDIFKSKQPLYSAANVLKAPPPMSDVQLDYLLRHGQSMLGSAAKIRFLGAIRDLENMSYKSGSWLNKVVTVAMNSADPEMALNHESYHAAEEMFMTDSERNYMNSAFRRNTDLNRKVREMLGVLGQSRAADQCDNASEAAAHAFSLWCKGLLSLESNEEAKPKGIFASIKSTIVDVVKWLSGEAVNKDIHSPEKLFAALRDGKLFDRYEQEHGNPFLTKEVIEPVEKAEEEEQDQKNAGNESPRDRG